MRQFHLAEQLIERFWGWRHGQHREQRKKITCVFRKILQSRYIKVEKQWMHATHPIAQLSLGLSEFKEISPWIFKKSPCLFCKVSILDLSSWIVNKLMCYLMSLRITYWYFLWLQITLFFITLLSSPLLSQLCNLLTSSANLTLFLYFFSKSVSCFIMKMCLLKRSEW